MAGNAFASREVCDMTILDFQTRKPTIFIDYANTSATELTGETVFAYGGKGHPKRVAFTGEKGGTFTVETQLATMQLYALITGGTIEKTAKFIKRVIISASEAGKLTISDATPIEGSVTVFDKDDDCGDEIKGTFSAGAFTATTESQIVSGKEYVVYFLENIASGVQKINIKNTIFPKACVIYADTYMKDQDDNVLPYKEIVYKAQPQSQITISQANSGDPATLTVTFDLMADADGNMLDLLLMEDE